MRKKCSLWFWKKRKCMKTKYEKIYMDMVGIITLRIMWLWVIFVFIFASLYFSVTATHNVLGLDFVEILKNTAHQDAKWVFKNIVGNLTTYGWGTVTLLGQSDFFCHELQNLNCPSLLQRRWNQEALKVRKRWRAGPCETNDELLLEWTNGVWSKGLWTCRGENG